MRKNYIYIICVILLSCNSNQKALNQERSNWRYKYWKQDFKDYTLCQCILKGYGKKDLVNSIKHIDRSFASPINNVVFDSTTQIIIRPVIAKLKRDSLQSLSQVSESAAGKHVFEECLNFYRSKRLDSIVIAEAKKWEKIKSIDSLVTKKMPSF